MIQAQCNDIRGRIAHVETSHGAEISIGADHSQGAVGGQTLSPSQATTTKDYTQGKYRTLKKHTKLWNYPQTIHFMIVVLEVAMPRTVGLIGCLKHWWIC